MDEIPSLPPKRDINFFSDLKQRVAPVFKYNDIMITPKLMQLNMQSQELLEK